MAQLIGQADTGEASKIDWLKSLFTHEADFVGAAAMLLNFAAKNSLGYTAANVVDMPQTLGSVRPMANPAVSISPSSLLEPPTFAQRYLADCSQSTVLFF